ncbi:MAG: hypothetical protein WC023_03110 [Rhodocyclaceae bacterium]
MRLLLHLFLAASAAVLFPASPAHAETPFSDRLTDSLCLDSLPTAAAWYAALQVGEREGRAGIPVAVSVDLSVAPGLGINAAGQLLYPMAYNNVAEGWSWQPLAKADTEDYYRWKYLPLQSVTEERDGYVQEDKIGEPQHTRVAWRYDYFLAFDNPYAFYPRAVDDEPGFVLPLAAAPGTLRLIALAVLAETPLADSTTFWKAIHARPVDFTLKKRYLIGRLEALVVCDGASGTELARLQPAAEKSQR